jgi:hypothetical protein
VSPAADSSFSNAADEVSCTCAVQLMLSSKRLKSMRILLQKDFSIWFIFITAMIACFARQNYFNSPPYMMIIIM